MEKNEIYEIEITDINNLGNGVGHIQNIVTFVPGGVDGDLLLVKIIKVTSSYLVARTEKIIRPSPHRIDSDCPISNRCGGCVYRNISYEHERLLKQGYIEHAFKKAGLSPAVLPVEHKEEAGYRNKVQFPVGKDLKTGFYALYSHTVIPCDECKLEDPDFAPILKFTCEYLKQAKVSPYDEHTGKGRLRHIYMRKGKATGDIMLCLVSNTAKFPAGKAFAVAVTKRFPAIKTVLLNVNSASTNVILGDKFQILYGDGYIEDILCSLRFRISAPSFWQVNHDMAELLYQKVSELANVREGEKVCDLFCGTGSIGLSVIHGVKGVLLLGIEAIPEAVENAAENARINGIKNARFVCADANCGNISGSDIIIIDPPRKGCAPGLIDRIKEVSPRAVIYVSCNPDTLARDCALFKNAGYFCNTVYPFDLFPRTGHVETVCLLSKLNVEHHIEVELTMDEMDLTAAEKKASYEEIKEYVLEKFGMKVSHLYIAQVKRKCGIIERENYNKPKSEDARQPQCPPEKEAAIRAALEHFGMI